MNNFFLKGLLMTVVAFVATTIQTNGAPADSVAWTLLGITTVGTVVTYIAQSVAFPSTSILGTVNTRDFLKASLLAVGNMLSSFGASYITGTPIHIAALLMSAATIVLIYFLKQLATPVTA